MPPGLREALGPNRPLTVTAGHALPFGDMPVNAGAPAEDGTPIRFAPLEEMPARFNYWHVELEEHECIVANGVPAESFIDYVGRSGFDNYGEYLDLVGADRLIAEMPLPRISARRLLPANRSDDADALIRLARLRLSTPRPAALRRRNRSAGSISPLRGTLPALRPGVSRQGVGGHGKLHLAQPLDFVAQPRGFLEIQI